MPAKVALVTCRNLPEPDNDEQITLHAFQNAGIDTTLAAWDDPHVDWSNFDLTILRSTWDYPEKPIQFAEFIREIQSKTNLQNPAQIVLENINKAYLLNLEQSGVPIIPTVEITGSNKHIVISDLFPNSDKIVIKPNIGAGSWGIKVFDRTDTRAHHEHIDFLTQEGTTPLVQPYLKSVERGGERSIVLIDGEPTHKIVKSPRFHGDNESVSVAQPVSDQESAFAKMVLKTLTDETLYARIDVILSDENEMLLSELEVIEPSLFFLQNPSALDTFVKAAAKRL